MRIERIGALVFAVLAACSGQAWAGDWKIVRLRDEFTDVSVCRIEPDGAFSRGLARGLSGSYRSIHFFAENRDGEVRAGFISEPAMPIPGDIQLRVDDRPMRVIAAADTPIDSGPSIALPPMPNVSEDMRSELERTLRASLSVASPYRVVVGDQARALLRELIAGQQVRWRVLAINAAASSTGRIRVGDLARALGQCGVEL